jgi:hypothetical protein
MSALDTLEFIEGDTLPIITGALKDDAGVAIDIRTWDIKLHIGYATPLIKVATIPQDASGTFSFPWVPTDLQEGTFDAEIQITSPSGIQTAQKTTTGKRFKIKVYPQEA